ncbi:MAG: putative ribosomal N-acetyltransferase YdaF [Pelotomaculum sp. PtaB.Bin013]|nr:MAG: putative ribosomal N-acetyltransferase YdaF [Pelotomaculum sp. PtaB.Bin013]
MMFSIEGFKLRQIEKSDLEKILNWRNSDRIRANMFSDHIITMEEHLAWYQRIKQAQNVRCNIFEYNKEPIGLVNFTEIDRKNSICFWGFYLGESKMLGTGLIMGYLGLNYAFNIVDIRKVYGQVFAFNLHSVNFFKKLGFMEEGRFRKHVIKNGVPEDVIFFGLFKEEWNRKKVALEKIVFEDNHS